MSEKRYDAVCCGQCGAKFVRLYRPGGEFRRPESDRCLAHITHEQHGYYIPLVLTEDGEAWGYTSATDDDIEIWKAMSEAVQGLPRCASSWAMTGRKEDWEFQPAQASAPEQ